MQTSTKALLLALALAFGLEDAAADDNCQKADAELNRVYREVRSRYRDDPLFLEKLKIAQRAWIKFRDAHIESQYPQEDKIAYGSIYGMCSCAELAKLTRARTKQLRLWLVGIEEGEGCYGSVKLKHQLE